MPKKPESPSSKTKKASTTTKTKSTTTAIKKAQSNPKKKKKSMHPKYEEMIARAIVHYKDRTGSSTVAIKKYILANYDVPDETLLSRHLKIALRKGLEDGILTKYRASYKVQPELREKLKKADRQDKTKKSATLRSRSASPSRSSAPRTQPAARSRSVSPVRGTQSKKVASPKKAPPRSPSKTSRAARSPSKTPPTRSPSKSATPPSPSKSSPSKSVSKARSEVGAQTRKMRSSAPKKSSPLRGSPVKKPPLKRTTKNTTKTNTNTKGLSKPQSPIVKKPTRRAAAKPKATKSTK